MKKKIIVIFVMMLLVGTILPISAQIRTNDLEEENYKTQLNGGWYKTFGGEDDERFRWVEQTSDGGYIIAGDTKSIGAGDKDAWLIKTDSNGIEQWSLTLGATGWDGFGCVQQLSDDGFIAGGWYDTSVDSDWVPWLVRTDADGIIIFDKKYPEPGFKGEFTNVRVTADDGYIMGGIEFLENGRTNPLIAKTDSDGNLLWMKSYGSSTNNEPIVYGSFEITPDGGYIAVALVFGGDAGVHSWMMKFDSEGDIEWDKILAHNPPFGSQLHCLGLTTDGGYILGGNCGLFYFGIGGCNMWILKTDSSGTMDWQQTLGFPLMFSDTCLDARQTADGGYILTGYAFGIGGCLINKDAARPVRTKICAYKLSDSGAVEWKQIIQGTGQGIRIKQTDDGGYILAGYTGTPQEGGDGVLVKLDSNGNID